MSNGVYGDYAADYFAAGMWPLPIWPGEKASLLTGWHELIFDKALVGSLAAQYPSYGIGIRLGSPTGLQGRVLACLDVDRDIYNAATRVLFDGVICGKVGKKGLTVFVQASEKALNREFALKEPHLKHLGKVAEFFVRKKLTVIPPTIHPETGKSYEWIGTPLLDMDLTKLPIVEV